jgi:hypothetical protein
MMRIVWQQLEGSQQTQALLGLPVNLLLQCRLSIKVLERGA